MWVPLVNRVGLSLFLVVAELFTRLGLGLVWGFLGGGGKGGLRFCFQWRALSCL